MLLAKTRSVSSASDGDVPSKSVSKAVQSKKMPGKSHTKSPSKLNISHDLSISDLLTKSFASQDHSEKDVEYYFWGVDLTCSSPSLKWTISHPDDECEDDMRHLLCLKRATLGLNAVAKERNIVQVSATGRNEEVVKTILCSLRLGERENCDLDLMLDYDHEVRFELVEGSGPVHLVGNHVVETLEERDEETDDSDRSLEIITQGGKKVQNDAVAPEESEAKSRDVGASGDSGANSDKDTDAMDC